MAPHDAVGKPRGSGRSLFPTAFVVKNGSKIRRWMPRGMPVPSSANVERDELAIRFHHRSNADAARPACAVRGIGDRVWRR